MVRKPAIAVVFLAALGALLFGMADLSADTPTKQRTQSSPTSPQQYRAAELLMGTVVRLTVESDSPEAAQEALTQAQSTMRGLVANLDHRNPQGDIGRINAAAGTAKVRVSSHTFGLVQRSLTLCEASQGVFDITIGAVTATSQRKTPSPLPPDEKADMVGCHLVELDEAEQSVFLPMAGMALDLGGVAKGAVVDAAVAHLKASGVEAGLVEAGGDLFAFGRRQWTAGLKHPRAKGLLGSIRLREAGLCGSGDYRRFWTDEQGRRQHHILDPAKLTSATASIAVYVVAPTAEQADGLATTLFVLGPKAGLKWLAADAPVAGALWVTPELELVISPGFPPLDEGS